MWLCLILVVLCRLCILCRFNTHVLSFSPTTGIRTTRVFIVYESMATTHRTLNDHYIIRCPLQSIIILTA